MARVWLPGHNLLGDIAAFRSAAFFLGTVWIGSDTAIPFLQHGIINISAKGILNGVQMRPMGI